MTPHATPAERPGPVQLSAEERACVSDDCPERTLARNLCKRHYAQMSRAGRLHEFPKQSTPSPEERFWLSVDKTLTCWLWTGQINAYGYGHFWTGVKTRRAHRVSFEMHRGEIPSGMVLDHLCRVRHCVNPWHLEAVTGLENWRRGISYTAAHARQTHCKNGHEFSPENTKIQPKTGQRVCRECRRQVNRRYRRRRAGVVA